jgi:hypothetical protein
MRPSRHQLQSTILYTIYNPRESTLYKITWCALSNDSQAFERVAVQKSNVIYLSTAHSPDVAIASRRRW